MRHLLFTTALVFLLIFVFSCKKDNQDYTPDVTVKTDIHDLEIPDNFSYAMQEVIELRLVTIANDGIPLNDVRMDIFTAYPSYENLQTGQASVLYSGLTDTYGVLETRIQVPTHLDSIYVSPRLVGLPEGIPFATNASINYTFGGQNFGSQNRSTHLINQEGYYTIGGWDNSGMPDYIEAIPDIVDQGLLEDINTSLPENVPGGIPSTHPEFLENVETNITLDEDAELWVTFVHEGAGYKNSLGYFTYPENDPPSSVSDIDNMTIAFPNVSYQGSGGSLQSGDKVQLKYYDEQNETFVNEFPAGTVVGWFLVANGWKNNEVGNGKGRYYSIKNFNPETNADLQQHNVLLYDDQRNLMLIGFEDLNRQGWCDQDFNDAVFYATASPITAIKTTNVEVIDTESLDADNDGINDNVDDYPDDPNKAFNNYYPNSEIFGTLAFEDLWPSAGDYDFNDLVVDYQFNRIANPNNEVMEIEAKFILKALGASFNNGFAFELPIISTAVQSVTGVNIQENYITLSSNGTEAGQTKAVIVVFDNGFNILPHPGGGQTGVNTTEGVSYVEADTITVNITFNQPLSDYAIGSPPYNPFIIVNMDRGAEVHLPDMSPTDLANTSYFGTGDDNSIPGYNRYYKSSNNLPWAMNIPHVFDYPKEKASVLGAHLKFGQWAESNGYNYTDWYLDKSQYRNNSKVYSK
jgi:LruC domain-containing protein